VPTVVHSNATGGEPAGHNAASWIDDGQKYALIALSVKLDDPVPPRR
jgi:hypothetical protein